MDPKKYPIRYFADLNPGTGYNNATRGMVAALECLGYDPSTLRLIPAIRANMHASALETKDKLEKYMHGDWLGDDSNDRINIVHLNPGMVGGYHTSLDGRWNIAITAWETDQLPKVQKGKRNVVGDLNMFDEVWVPTKWVGEMFTDCGVSARIRVIPHVLLPEILKTQGTLAPNTNETVFYYIGSWNPRKNPTALFRSYLLTGWTPVDKTKLQIYSVPPTRESAHVAAHCYFAQESIREMCESAGDKDSIPPYAFHGTYVPYNEVVRRHASGHVFVTASRGEGFCLPALEAVAMGNWVIGGGPWLEELAEVAGSVENGGPVDVLPTEKVPITPVPDCKGYELDQKWWNVRIEDLKHAMVAAHEARREAGFPGGVSFEGAKKVREFYGPESVSKRIREGLKLAVSVLQDSGW